MDYTTESQIKQVEYSEKSAVQECLLLPSALFGFHNTATTVEQTKSGRDVFVLYLSKVFGEADPELTATVVGAVGEETLNYSLTRAPGEDAGEYAITVTLGENPNYDVTVGEDGVFTIDPAQVEVLIVGHNSTVVYDRETHTVRGYDFEADDERYLETYFSFSGNAVAERKNAGTTQMGLSEEQFTNNNANFAVTFTVIDGWQKIEPKLVENPFYVIGGGAQYYDGTEKRPGIKVFDDDTLVPSYEYTVSYSENVNAGTAIITVQNVDDAWRKPELRRDRDRWHRDLHHRAQGCVGYGQ